MPTVETESGNVGAGRHPRRIITIMEEADKNGNVNCLYGLECPQCLNHEEIMVEVTTMMGMSDHGMGDHGDTNFDDESYAECPACLYAGTLKDFNIKQP